MTITNNSIRISTNGDGVTTVFPVSFPFYEQTELVVILVQSDGTEVTQTLTTDYTVTGGNGSTGSIAMVTEPSSGERLVRYRVSPLTQETDYADGDAFPADSHEAALDRLTMQNQEQADKLARALTLSESSEVASSLTMEEPVAGRALKWNSTEDGIINTSVDLETLEANIAADAAQTALDRIATAADVISSAANASAAQVAAAANLYASVEEKTTSFTVASTDDGTLFCVDTSADNVVVTLPNIAEDVADGFRFGIVKCAAINTVTINRVGEDTVNGGTSYLMSADTEFVTLIADDATPDNWITFGASTTSAGSGLSKSGSTLSLKPVIVEAIALGDETTAIAAGSSIATFHAPTDFTLTGAVAGLTTAQTSGSILTFDINEAGVSILSTKLTIDNTEDTSITAATPAVLSDTAIAAGAKLTVDIDQVGNGSAKGAKIYLLGYPA